MATPTITQKNEIAPLNEGRPLLFFLRSTNRMRKIASRSMSEMMGKEDDGISCHMAGLASFEGLVTSLFFAHYKLRRWTRADGVDGFSA
jgi:hypothetical protein